MEIIETELPRYPDDTGRRIKMEACDNKGEKHWRYWYQCSGRKIEDKRKELIRDVELANK